MAEKWQHDEQTEQLSLNRHSVHHFIQPLCVLLGGGIVEGFAEIICSLTSSQSTLESYKIGLFVFLTQLGHNDLVPQVEKKILSSIPQMRLPLLIREPAF